MNREERKKYISKNVLAALLFFLIPLLLFILALFTGYYGNAAIIGATVISTIAGTGTFYDYLNEDE